MNSTAEPSPGVLFRHQRRATLALVIGFLLAAGTSRGAEGVSPVPAAASPQPMTAGAGGRSTGGVALVDIPKVWFLHPYMVDFILEANSFLRPLPADADPGSRPITIKHKVEEAERAARVARDEIVRLEAENRHLKVEELKQTDQMNEELSQLRAKLQAAIARAPARRKELEAEFAREQTQLEEQMWKRKRFIFTTVTDNRRTINLKRGESLLTAFLSDVERDERFRTMAVQIGQAIDQTTAGRFALVINSGYRAPVQRGGERSAPYPTFIPKSIEAYVNPYHDFWTLPPDGPIEPNRKTLVSRLSLWLSNRTETGRATPAGLNLFGFVARHGIDITEQVVEKLLTNLPLSSEKRAIVLRSVRTR
jgi:hypothetical protein